MLRYHHWALIIHSKTTTLVDEFSFSGSYSIIEHLSWARLITLVVWTECECECEFEYGWYPFDVQNCFIHGKLPGEIIIDTQFKNVTYSGHHDLGKYQFRGLKFCNVDKYGRLGIFVDLSFKRPLTGHFITMFLPTGMLLLISQMSTTFSGTFLEMVIEVNTTLLLVLTTL